MYLCIYIYTYIYIYIVPAASPRCKRDEQTPRRSCRPLPRTAGAGRIRACRLEFTVKTRRWECDRTGSRTHVLWVHDWGPYH